MTATRYNAIVVGAGQAGRRWRCAWPNVASGWR